MKNKKLTQDSNDFYRRLGPVLGQLSFRDLMVLLHYGHRLGL